MSFVPIFAPLAIHLGRPVLELPAAATATMIAVGRTADPLLTPLIVMIVIEGARALLALILPAMASGACATQLGAALDPANNELCETHYGLLHPASSALTTDQTFLATDLLSRGGIGIVMWIFTRLGAYAVGALSGYLIAHWQAGRAREYRETAKITVDGFNAYKNTRVAAAAAAAATATGATGTGTGTKAPSWGESGHGQQQYKLIMPRPTCDLWYNTWLFNISYPIYPEDVEFLDARKSPCAQTGAPPAMVGWHHSKPGLLWLLVWVIGWLLITLLIKTWIPIYNSTAYASGFNSTYHVTFVCIIAMFGSYVLHMHPLPHVHQILGREASRPGEARRWGLRPRRHRALGAVRS
jgi:hypothetical protein